MAPLAAPTVLVVSATETRSVSISPRLLYAAKPLIVCLTLAVGALTAGLGALGWVYLSDSAQHTASTQQLKQQVTDLQNYTSAEINAKLASLEKSEQMVSDLQKYLNERGIHIKPATVEPKAGKPTPSAGGPLERPLVSQPVPFTGTFAQDAETLLQAIQRTPIGLPHNGALTSRFGNRANPFSGRGAESHTGLDFRGTTGEPIRATAGGKVSVAAYQNGYGNMVRIAHGNGYETLFGHMSQINVQEGQTVKAGEVIGLVGSTGRSTGPHLHYEVLRGGERLDPEQFLALNALPQTQAAE